MLKPGRPDARAVAEHCGVELSMVGQWAHPGMSLPDGVLPLSLHVEVSASTLLTAIACLLIVAVGCGCG